MERPVVKYVIFYHNEEESGKGKTHRLRMEYGHKNEENI